MMRSTFALIFGIFASTSHARELQVISGDHENFVRLVVLTTRLPEWRIGRVDDTYILKMTNDTSFDLNGVYNLIPRTRIAEIRDEKNGQLSILVSCNCYLDAFTIPSGLVIDVRDGEPPVGSIYETNIPVLDADNDLLHSSGEALPPANQTQPRIVTGLWDEVSEDSTDDSWQGTGGLGGDIGTTDASEPETQRLDLSTRLGEPTDIAAASPQAEATYLRQFESSLLEGFAQASAQGLLSLNQGTATSQETSSDEIAEEPATTAMNNETLLTDQNQAMVRTAFNSQNLSKHGDNESLNGCMDDTHFRIAEWGPTLDEEREFSNLRANIVTASGTIDQRVVEKLVKRYLYYSFGLEAQTAIKEFGSPQQNFEALNTIATIVDQDAQIDGLLGVDQVSCPTRVALWAMLANSDVAKYGAVADEAVLLAFSELPSHLRSHLGSRLANRFMSLDEVDIAARISAAMARTPYEDQEGVAFVEAEIRYKNGNKSDAFEKYESIVEADGSFAPDAAIKLIDGKIKSGIGLSSSLLNRVMALSDEIKNTPIGIDLLQAIIRAKAHSGEYNSAINQISKKHQSKDLTTEQARILTIEVLELMAAEAKKNDFIELVVSDTDYTRYFSGYPRLAIKFADRMNDLGMRSDAISLINTVNTDKKSDGRRLLARIALVEYRPEKALSIISDDSSEEADQIRAEALRQLKNFDKSLEIYRRLGNIEKQVEILALLERWEDIREIAQKNSANVSEIYLIDSNLENNDNSQVSIDRGREILSGSETLRVELKKFLQMEES